MSSHQGMNGVKHTGTSLSAAQLVQEAVLGKELYKAVTQAALLVVGAGGIGCELLKNLVLTGFHDIEVIDLDTIDVSNLNRQFFFRARHVGQPKAYVARDVILQLNPAARIRAHHDNVKASHFGINYFKRFTLVLNALDNADARRHVNRMCLATEVPMIDAGTTGYVGQVNVIKKGDAACFECEEKATQKVYPICTIRSTPDKPVHCIVWAKEFYRLLFGQADASMLYEAPDAPEPSLYMPLLTRRPGRDAHPKEAAAWALAFFRATFHDDLAMRIQRGLYKTSQRSPQPTTLFGPRHTQFDAQLADGGGGQERQEEGWERHVWGEEQSVRELLRCVARIWADETYAANLGSLAFDKDDVIAMRFVTAAANLRALSFNIPTSSYHDTKGIAGNIIPAIATTNAMAAGLQVLEALKILRAPPHCSIVEAGCKVTYITRGCVGRKQLLLQPTDLHPPNPACFVCQRAGVEVALDTESRTLKDFVEKVLKSRLSFAQPSVTLEGSNIIYEEGEGADPDLADRFLGKILSELPAGGIRDQVVVECEDFSQDLTLQITVHHRVLTEEEAPEGFILLGGGVGRAIKEGRRYATQERRVREEGEREVGSKRGREEATEDADEGSKKAKVSLVDLAGAEDVALVVD